MANVARTTAIAQKTMTVNSIVTGKVAQPTTTQMPDLTAMSDQDLLSYINPSCFDQGLFLGQNPIVVTNADECSTLFDFLILF